MTLTQSPATLSGAPGVAVEEPGGSVPRSRPVVPAQLALDIAPLVEPDYEPSLSIDERFAIFHAANPHVADALEALARQWVAAGRKKLGAKALMERLRWESGIQTEGDVYRLNNDYSSRYSRLLAKRHPEWTDLFETRALAKERAT